MAVQGEGKEIRFILAFIWFHRVYGYCLAANSLSAALYSLQPA